MPEIVQMLFGQQFGRRHQRNLVARLHRRQRRQRRDHGLAAADVALHQPQHRPWPCQVALDFTADPLLRGGQAERQPGKQWLAQGAAALQLRRMPTPQCRAHALQAQVLGQQFLERQSLLCRMLAQHELAQVGVRRRPVHVQQRIAQ